MVTSCGAREISNRQTQARHAELEAKRLVHEKTVQALKTDTEKTSKVLESVKGRSVTKQEIRHFEVLVQRLNVRNKELNQEGERLEVETKELW